MVNESKLNNLNLETSKSEPPDLIRNLPHTEDIKDYNKDIEYHKDGSIQPPYPIKAPGQLYSVEEKGRKSDRPRGKKKKILRGVCCLAWIVCFPLYCLCWSIRESPVDEEDLRNDDCYPCYA